MWHGETSKGWTGIKLSRYSKLTRFITSADPGPWPWPWIRGSRGSFVEVNQLLLFWISNIRTLIESKKRSAPRSDEESRGAECRSDWKRYTVGWPLNPLLLCRNNIWLSICIWKREYGRNIVDKHACIYYREGNERGGGRVEAINNRR